MSLRRKLAVVAGLYFVEGFPMGVFGDVLPVWFRREGIPLEAIGWLSALGLAWSAKVLWSPHENMMSADYEMVGVLGRLTQPIREGGIGEIVYTQGGTRKSCGARSADGAAIDKGSEVVVTGYDRGIASVKRWSDLAES